VTYISAVASHGSYNPANGLWAVGALPVAPVHWHSLTAAPRAHSCYTFSALGSNTDDLEFSSDGGATYTYMPVPDADGFDSNVTHFRGLTGGAFATSNGVNNPSFSFQFRVRV